MIWSENDLDAIFKTVERIGPNTREICELLDLTPGQLGGIRRRNPDAWADAVEVFESKNPRLSPEVKNKHLKDNIKLRTERSELEQQLKHAVKEESLIETLRNAIEESVIPLTPSDEYPEPVRASKAGTSRETMMLLVSDLHGGEIVKAERVKFLNHYDSNVCQQRFGHYIKSHLGIKERLEAGQGWKFPELVVNLLGDIVSGTIHEMERHSDQTIVKTCMGMAAMIAEGIEYLAQHYPEVHVVGVVGNHGRLPDQRKKAYKDPERNWDYVIYLAIAQYLKNIPNVRCFFPESYTLQLNVRGHLFQLQHGDDCKSWGGLPAYGLDRYARNQNAGEAARGGHIDYFLMGHFHSQTQLDVSGADLMVNGDFKGTDEFVLGALGKTGVPRQMFFGVHEEHGITHKWEVKLNNPEEDVPRFAMSPWLDVTEEDGKKIDVYKIG